MQLLFIRKEIENKTVRDSSLLRDAVQVAVNNCLSKRKARLWLRNKRKEADLPVSLSEIDAIQEQMEKNTPWTPWQKVGGD